MKTDSLKKCSNKIFKWLFAIGLTITIAIISILILLFIWIKSQIITNISKYNQLLDKVEDQKDISHFPKSIPANAQNVKFHGYVSDYNGALIILKFEIDKDYITREFEANKFINPKTKLGEKQKIYNMPLKLINENENEFTFYVLKNAANENVKEYFPYFNGIGIKNDSSAILYYYILPGD